MVDMGYEHRGYRGEAAWDSDANVYRGEVIGIEDTVTFQAETLAELRNAFVASVGDYLEMGEWWGRTPQQPDKPNEPDKSDKAGRAEADFEYKGHKGKAAWHEGGSAGVGYYKGRFISKVFSGLTYLTTQTDFGHVVDEYIADQVKLQEPQQPRQSTMYDKRQADINRILEATNFSHANGDYVYSTIEEIIKGIAHSLTLDRSVVEFHLGKERLEEIEQKIEEAKASAASRTNVNTIDNKAAKPVELPQWEIELEYGVHKGTARWHKSQHTEEGGYYTGEFMNRAFFGKTSLTTLQAFKDVVDAHKNYDKPTHVNPLTTALADLENMMSQLEKAGSEIVAAKQDVVFINRDIVRLLVDNNMDYLLRANWHEIDKVLDKEGNDGL